jgi:hypothetical protein
MTWLVVSPRPPATAAGRSLGSGRLSRSHSRSLLAGARAVPAVGSSCRSSPRRPANVWPCHYRSQPLLHSNEWSLSQAPSLAACRSIVSRRVPLIWRKVAPSLRQRSASSGSTTRVPETTSTP